MNIDLVLSPEGIDKAIKKLEWYKSNLRVMQQRFVDRLLQSGYRVVNRDKGKATGDSDTSFVPTVSIKRVSDNAVRGTLSISGKDVLFVEFGAGVHYNGALGSSPNPKGLEFGYFIGSYPNQQYAGEDYWFYKNENGERVMSHGTKAAMPMYNASQDIRGHFASIAREVFNTDG